jgi:hypothetical protein
MTRRKKIRKLKHLAGDIGFFGPSKKDKLKELYKLGEELGYSKEKVDEIRTEQINYRYESQKEHEKKPPKETRDNKQVHVGGGCPSSYPTYRYPSKKRNKKTWSNFYKLFPDLALRDGWDGKTSSKMK